MITENITERLKEKVVSYKIFEFNSPFESSHHVMEMIKTPLGISKSLVFHDPFSALIVRTSKQLRENQIYPSGGRDNSAIEILATSFYIAADKGVVNVCK